MQQEIAALQYNNLTGERIDMAFQMWAPYVPVHQRRANAARELAKLAKKGGFSAQPVRPIEGRAIANTFWGRAWCDHLERYSDFDNRLPRGRTYVRNGSVVHLEVQSGVVHARVSGSSMYTVKVEVEKLAPARWQTLARECQGSIGTRTDRDPPIGRCREIPGLGAAPSRRHRMKGRQPRHPSDAAPRWRPGSSQQGRCRRSQSHHLGAQESNGQTSHWAI